MPNQLLISVRLRGVGKPLIASKYFGSGSTVSFEIRNPAKSTVVELELFRVEYDTCPAAQLQEVNRSPPECIKVFIVEKAVIHAPFHPCNMGGEIVQSPVIPITARQESLWRSLVSEEPPWSSECGKMAVFFSDWDRMVAVPCIPYGFH